jgi:hypothetical protein
MNFSNKISHELTNNVEAILNALDAIEIKLASKDIKGALYTLGLIKDKKIDVLETIQKIQEHLNEKES